MSQEKRGLKPNACGNFPGAGQKFASRKVAGIICAQIFPARTLPESIARRDSDAVAPSKMRERLGDMKIVKTMTLATVAAMLVTGFALIFGGSAGEPGAV